MRPDDSNDPIAKALAELDHLSEEDQANFAEFQERLVQSREEFAREMEELRETTLRLTKNPDKLIEATRRRGEIADEVISELTVAFVEQSDLIERIAGR